MDIKLFFGILAGLLAVVSLVPYIIEIFRGDVKPHRVTWGIWTILTSIVLVNQIANNGGFSILFNVATASCVTIIFILSMFKGVGGADTLDRFVLSFSGLLFLGWVISGNTTVTTFIAVMIDVLACVPTFVKAYQEPKTEIYSTWIIGAAGGIFSVLALESFAWVTAIFPLYISVANMLIVLAKYVGEQKLERPHIG